MVLVPVSFLLYQSTKLSNFAEVFYAQEAHNC